MLAIFNGESNMKRSWFTRVYNLRSEKRILFSFIVISVILFLAIAIGESYVRLISSDGYISPEIQKHKMENTNLIYAPSLFSKNVFPQKEHFVKYSIRDSFRFELEDGFEDSVKWYINEKGYRGLNFSVAKPEGKIRIIVYGGSFVFDIRTKKGKDWPHLLQEILQNEGYPVEVINAGIPGHMSFDSFGRFFTEGHLFNPDFVIICNKWNDIKYFRSDEPLLRTFVPRCGSADPRYQYSGWLDRTLGEISQLYSYIRNDYFVIEPVVEPIPPKPKEVYSSYISEIALKQYKLNIQLFVDAAKNLGITPILMTQPLLINPDNTEHEKEIIESDKVRLNHDVLNSVSDRADNIVQQIAKEKDVILIEASHHLSKNEVFFTDQVHLTPDGATELAKFVSFEIKKLLNR